MRLGVLLTVIFAVLKLTGLVGWTWPGVLVPLFIAFGIYALILLAGFAVAVGVNVASK
jgi:hypothetical protein